MAYPSGRGSLDVLAQHFNALTLVGQSPVADLYTGFDQAGAPVSVLVLTGSAAADQQVRDAFAAAVRNSSFAPQAGDLPIHAAELSGPHPWAATYQRSGQPGAERLLAGLPGGPLIATTPDASLTPTPPGAAPGWSPNPGYSPAPQRSGAMSTGAKTALVAGGLVLVLLVGLGVLVAARALTEPEPIARPTSSPSPRAIPSSPGATAVPDDPDESGGPGGQPGEPSLRETTAVTVLGPSFAEGEETYTMAFPDWPFAFRAPKTWGCMGGRSNIPDSKAWVCIDEGNPGSRQRAHVLLRPCATTCTAAEQKAMNQAWLDESERVKVVRERTYYVETLGNDKGMYTVDASHFFSDPRGGAGHWQVGVYVESPPASRDEVLKLLNDVVTQAG